MNMLDKQAKTLSKPLEDLYVKAPALPVGAKEFIVSIAPWAALVFGVLAVVGSILGLLGLGAAGTLAGAYAPQVAAVAFSGFWFVPLILGFVNGLLMLLAFKSLQKRHLRGWNLMFWVFLVSLVSSLFSSTIIFFSVMGLVWLLVWLVVELYFLFQVKSYYK